MKTSIVALLMLVCGVATQAQAQVQAQVQTVWRCGPDGRSYSSTPCAGGRALAVDSDARPDADVQAARHLAKLDRSEAERLRHERLQQEARHGNGLVAITSARPAPTSTATARVPHKPQRPKTARPPKPLQQLGQVQPADADTWQATAPLSRRTTG